MVVDVLELAIACVGCAQRSMFPAVANDPPVRRGVTHAGLGRYQDWDMPLPPRHICPGSGFASATSARGLAQPVRPDHPCICTGTGPILPHLRRDWAHPLPHLRRDWAHPMPQLSDAGRYGRSCRRRGPPRAAAAAAASRPPRAPTPRRHASCGAARKSASARRVSVRACAHRARVRECVRASREPACVRA